MACYCSTFNMHAAYLVDVVTGVKLAVWAILWQRQSPSSELNATHSRLLFPFLI